MGKSPQDHLQVAVLGKNVYVKIYGFATQQNCLGIPDFLDAMFRVGCTSAVFDMSDSRGVDSTFLGVVADAATALSHRRGKSVVVLNADRKVKRQMQRVGLLPLIRLREEKVELPEDVELREVDFLDFPANEQDRLERIRDLHQRLVDLNEGNRQLYGSFITMLGEELKKACEADQTEPTESTGRERQ